MNFLVTIMSNLRWWLLRRIGGAELVRVTRRSEAARAYVELVDRFNDFSSPEASERLWADRCVRDARAKLWESCGRLAVPLEGNRRVVPDLRRGAS